jgi:predicted nuclease of predicted toxin-antitoxin system
VRFVTDHNVAATVVGVLRAAGHDCWSAADAGLYDVADDELAVYAADRKAALLSHDVDFARRRMRNTVGQHVWLRCPEPDAAVVITRHLTDLLGVLERMPDVVVELRPDSNVVWSPRWE